MSDTLLLDQANWDLCVDAAGNIARATAPYAVAQDVACAIRLFLGELWYDTTQGVPYLGQILGQNPPLGFVKQAFVDAALTVPSVATAVCVITDYTNRVLSGQVQITDNIGAQSVVAFGGTQGQFVVGAESTLVGSAINVLG